MAHTPLDRFQRRSRAGLVPVAVLLAVAGCHTGGPPRVSPLPVPPPAAHREAVTVEGGSTVFMDDQGKTLWKVSAKQIVGQITAGRVDLKDARCLLYSQGKPAWSCKADSITADKPNEAVRMEGNVSGTSMNGDRAFRVPAATWNVKTGALVGEPRVWLRAGNIEITGDRLIGNTNENKGEVIGHARGRFMEKRG